MTETFFAAIGICLTLFGVAIAAAQVWVAVSANKQAILAQQEADRQRLNDDRRFALTIGEPMVTKEVHTILNKSSPSPDDLSFLQALYDLCDVRGEALLSAEVKDDETIAKPIFAALEPVRGFLERNGLSIEDSLLDSKLGQVDHSKDSWEGTGRHSKIWTINLIAQRWATTHQIVGAAEFEESFGAELRAAVPERAGEYNRDWLLTPTSDKYLPSLLLNLDGTAYGIHWRCGFKNSQIGKGVHRPIIEHFIAKHSFSAVGL